MGLKEPYSGQCELKTGEIAEDLTYYFATSEQIPSAVGLGVLVDKDQSVKQAGGFIIQLMPFTPEDVVDRLEKKITEIDSVTQMLDRGLTPEQFKRRLDEKVRLLEEDTYRLSDFSEFGLRRRLSAEAQEMAVKAIAEVELPADSHFIGTSNVYLAKKFNLKPVGTMAHEWIMCTGQGNHKHNPAYSNWYALDAWVKEYGILNGIALTDTITTDCFLRDFQLTYATLFSGVRHDSGDPYEWGDKMIAHYNSLGINPRTKTLLFSDSLDFERATALYDYFKDKAKVAFGIGTFISNDTDEDALNIVMKTTKCNGMDVAKISDVAGKGMCKNPDYVDYLNRCIDYRMKNDK